MKIADHLKSTCLIPITNLGHQYIVLGKLWINKNKVMLGMAEDHIIYMQGCCDHDEALISTLSLKPQTTESQSDDKPHTATFSTFPIKQIKVETLAAATTPLTPASAISSAFKIKKKMKPKLNTEIANLTPILDDEELKLQDIAEMTALSFHPLVI